MELDDAYANAAHIPGAETYPPRWAAAAAAFRSGLAARGRAEIDIPYGASPRQALDLFHPAGQPRGLCVFVHGGYWLRFDKSFWSHLAAGPLARGWSVAIPSYDLCPDVRISDITRQISRAVEVAAGRVHGAISLAGHSAGGHLVARICAPGFLSPGVADRLVRVVPISPVSDLRPLLQTTMNERLGLDMAAAERESPVLMSPPDLPVTVVVGGDERPAFLEQARWLAEAWGCGHEVALGRHHFDVIEPLSRPVSDLSRLLCP